MEELIAGHKSTDSDVKTAANSHGMWIEGALWETEK